VNDHHHHDGSHRWLLLIPVTMLMAKAMHRGRRHRAWMTGPTVDGDPATGFRLPPRIEATLNAWHEQAHRRSAAGDSGPATSEA
jgi:hypothetical protein